MGTRLGRAGSGRGGDRAEGLITAGTIAALFEGAVERSSSKTWLLHGDTTFTYEEAARRIAAIAAVLGGHGVGRETVVLATARNAPGYVLAWLAVARLGGIWFAVNPESTPDELETLAGQVDPLVVVTDAELWEVASRAASGARMILVDELMSVPSAEPPPVAARPDDVAVLIPTSGTTGRSKLVMQTQRAYAMAGEGFPFWLGLTPEDRLMTSLPLFHVNAPAYSVLGSVAARASIVLLPRFSASRFLDEARRYGATEFNAIGAMLEILMRQPERPDDADTPLRLCYTGPSPPEERHLEIERRFGIEVVCGYALSESPYGLIWRHGTRPYGTLGSPRQHPTLGEVNEARVLDDEGHPADVDEVGELELRNPAVMRGYLGMPAEAAEVLSEDGWLRTGDLVRVDPGGTYTFVARRKEMIRRRGENLSPVEVEQALEAHPSVVEAAVVGVPSELSEEEVKAFVVLREDVSMSELRDHVAERLTSFKVPRYFEVLAELPHTPTGRIAKHELPQGTTGAEEDPDAS